MLEEHNIRIQISYVLYANKLRIQPTTTRKKSITYMLFFGGTTAGLSLYAHPLELNYYSNLINFNLLLIKIYMCENVAFKDIMSCF